MTPSARASKACKICCTCGTIVPVPPTAPTCCGPASSRCDSDTSMPSSSVMAVTSSEQAGERACSAASSSGTSCGRQGGWKGECSAGVMRHHRKRVFESQTAPLEVVGDITHFLAVAGGEHAQVQPSPPHLGQRHHAGPALKHRQHLLLGGAQAGQPVLPPVLAVGRGEMGRRAGQSVKVVSSRPCSQHHPPSLSAFSQTTPPPDHVPRKAPKLAEGPPRKRAVGV